jgi:hypothetical protein
MVGEGAVGEGAVGEGAVGETRTRTPDPATAVVAAEFSEGAPVAVGTAVWALLLVIGLFIRPDLIDSGRGWWIWSAVSGVILGLIGYLYLRRRQARLLARARSTR